MSKEMVISANPHETRVAILEEGLLCEFYVERQKEFALVGSIYKGRVTRVLPGMQSAFVEIGLDSDAFLYVSDFLEGIEEFDPIVTTVEEKVQKMEDQGGRVFVQDAGAPAMEPADVEAGPAPATENAASVSGEAAPAPPQQQQRPQNQFQNRGRDNRNLGRDRGRRGRHGGPGGRNRRGNDRRFGRELPSSKYASPHGDPTDEPVSSEPYVRVVLPGESFAKYKEKPASSAPAETAELAATAPVEAQSVQQSEPQPQVEVERPRVAEAHYVPAPFGPLPGESLSKYQNRPAAVPEAPAEVEHVAPEESASAHQGVLEADEVETDEVESGDVEPVIAVVELGHDLSEEEAAVIAEHVAEAQSEEAARAGVDRALDGEHDDAADEHADIEAHGESDSGADTEEDELEDEESDAEGEGMLAPSEEDDEHSEEGADVGEHEEVMAAQAEELHAESATPGAENSGGSPSQQQVEARVRNDFRSRMQRPNRRGGRDRDRGRRPRRGGFNNRGGHSHHGHKPQPRRPQLISELLKQGQEIIVQIAKEPLGKKGARITSHVALPGRFLVYMPTLDHTGVSRKIASAEERSRLRHLVNDAKGTSGGGFIVRTAASTAPPEDVRADVEFLTRTWSEIKSRAEQRKAPSLLHRDLNLIERILRDYLTPDFTAVWVDSEEEFTKVVDFMGRFQPQLVNRVKLYTKETPVFEEFGIQQEIDKSLRPKVWLKSGGYIVINHTEALVAIDVNTGKFVGKGSTRLEDTIVRTNLEAVKEIVRQMRLRDLGGIIVIDFIDMEDRRNREKVMAALEDALRADRAPSKMLRFNEFGLIAITRKRTKQALERTLCQPCPYCTGSGMVKSIPTLCYEIQNEARKMAPDLSSGSVTLRVHPEIAKALKTRESSLVEELEHLSKKSIIIQADPTLHWEQYDIY